MTFKRILLAGALALASAAASTAQAHARLQSSEPRAGSILDSAPRQLSLKFNEALEPAFSKIRLADAKNADIALPGAVVDKADQTRMAAPLPALGSGTYRVEWTAMSHDGHKVKGEFTFRIK